MSENKIWINQPGHLREIIESIQNIFLLLIVCRNAKFGEDRFKNGVFYQNCFEIIQ
jgi:hypothetical protein